MARLATQLLVLAVCLAVHVLAAATTPFLLWSGKTLPISNAPSSASRAELQDLVTSVGCAKVNVIFQQVDLRSNTLKKAHATTPLLRRSVESSVTSAQVMFVPMASGIEDLVEGIQKACGSNVAVVRASSGNDIADLAKETSKSPRIITVTLASPQPGAHEADSTIASVLTQIEKLVGDDWTAMLTGVQGMHTMDRRATSATAATASVIPYSKRAIFQKYIFFSPGLFMCFFAMLPLFIVAFLGVNILMSIQTPSRFEVKKKEK